MCYKWCIPFLKNIPWCKCVVNDVFLRPKTLLYPSLLAEVLFSKYGLKWCVYWSESSLYTLWVTDLCSWRGPNDVCFKTRNLSLLITSYLTVLFWMWPKWCMFTELNFQCIYHYLIMYSFRNIFHLMKNFRLDILLYTSWIAYVCCFLCSPNDACFEIGNFNAYINICWRKCSGICFVKSRFMHP